MGKAALEGRKGVVKVDKGWRDWREINTVVFDPELIGVKEMEEALVSAGTYKETLPADDEAAE